MEGESGINNAEEFYKPLLNWLDQYCRNPKEITRVRFNFDYLDTDSRCWLSDIFKKLEELYNNGQKVDIEWEYVKEYKVNEDGTKEFGWV